MPYDSYYGNYRQISFAECWSEVDEFTTDLHATEIPLPLTEEELKTLYYLLYSRYGNDIISASDINRFKFNVASIIFQYGGTWAKRLEIQKKLRELSEDELLAGAKQIHNRAENPSTAPSTQYLEELPYINSQTVSSVKRGKLDGYAYLWDLLDTDVTGEFLDKFKKLFLFILQPEKPLWYVTEEN